MKSKFMRTECWWADGGMTEHEIAISFKEIERIGEPDAVLNVIVSMAGETPLNFGYEEA